MSTLTDKQAAVLGFIRESVSSRGFAPTVREIGRRFGISSPNGVHVHLLALRRKGFIRWEASMSRTITILEQGA